MPSIYQNSGVLYKYCMCVYINLWLYLQTEMQSELLLLQKHDQHLDQNQECNHTDLNWLIVHYLQCVYSLPFLIRGLESWTHHVHLQQQSHLCLQKGKYKSASSAWYLFSVSWVLHFCWLCSYVMVFFFVWKLLMCVCWVWMARSGWLVSPTQWLIFGPCARRHTENFWFIFRFFFPCLLSWSASSHLRLPTSFPSVHELIIWCYI